MAWASKLPRSKLRGISPTTEVDFRLVPLLDIECISLSPLLSLHLLHWKKITNTILLELIFECGGSI